MSVATHRRVSRRRRARAPPLRRAQRVRRLPGRPGHPGHRRRRHPGRVRPVPSRSSSWSSACPRHAPQSAFRRVLRASREKMQEDARGCERMQRVLLRPTSSTFPLHTLQDAGRNPGCKQQRSPRCGVRGQYTDRQTVYSGHTRDPHDVLSRPDATGTSLNALCRPRVRPNLVAQR